MNEQVFSGFEVELSAVSGSIYIYDKLGKEVRKETMIDNEAILDLHLLPKREYILKIQAGKDVLVKKVLKIG